MTKFDFYPVDVRHRLEIAAAEYSFSQTEPTPWTPLRHELRQARAALVTTAGLRLKTQAAYQADRARGCAEWREISMYIPGSELAFDYTAYDPREAEADLNVLVPRDRLKELGDRQALGGVAETFFSFFPVCEDLAALRESAAGAARKMREAYDADVAFLFPADFSCNQTAAIVARELEREGLSTVLLSTVKEVTQQVRPPRALFVNFPFGRTLGPAHAVGLQRSILEDMIRMLRTQERPGRLTELPYRWEESPGE